MDPITIGLGLAQLAPLVLPLFTEDETANKTAKAVASAAQVVTGKTITTSQDEREAIEVLRNDPVKLLEFQTLMNEHAALAYQQETERLRIVNETIKAEVNSKDPVVRRMRPIFGYSVCLMLVMQMVLAMYVAVMHPERLAETLVGLAGMSSILMPALAVLGVYVYRRSDEKSGGASPMDLLGAMVKRK